MNRKTLPIVAMLVIAGLALSMVPLQQVHAQTPVTLNISSRYADGTPLSGMWTVLRSGSATAATGFTAVNFSLVAGSNYTVAPSNWQDITFHHWQDNNSTAAQRTVNIAQNSNLVAVYVSNAHPLPSANPPPPAPVVLNVNSVTESGAAVSGVYTVIKNAAGAVLLAQNTPLTYTVTSGSTYSVTPSDYEIFSTGSYKFVQWSDGNTSRFRSVTPTANTTLTAVYHNNPLGIKSITVNSADSNGNRLTGLMMNISPAPRANIVSQYSPASWTLEGDTAYTITPQDYGSYFFAHWQDGNVTRARTVIPTTGLNLTAYFSTSNDQTPPTVAILAPTNNQTLTSSQATISGTASDNIGVTTIDVSIDGGAFLRADGLAKWSFMSHSGLGNGTHTAMVKATDLAGNSATASVSFNLAVNPVLPKTGVYIPMYFPPTPGPQLDFYNSVAAEKQAHPSVPIVAVINPAGGPGTSFNQAMFNATNNLKAAGVTVIGYDPTLYGSRAPADVKADMDRYFAWYPAVTGIMLDEFANSAGYEAQYANYTAYAKSHGMTLVMGNAGADPPQSYIGTVDAIGITEGDGYPPASWLQYCVTCTTDGWHYHYDKNNFKFSRYAIDYLDPNFVHEASKWVGMFYVTNGVSPQRWNTLPPYFDQLVSELDAQ